MMENLIICFSTELTKMRICLNGLDEASSQNISEFVNSQIAALGRIASGKYEMIARLQWSVFFSSALFFVIAIVGFLKGVM